VSTSATTAGDRPPASPRSHDATARGRVLPFPITGQEIVLIGVIAALWVALSLATPAFLTSGSIVPLFVATAPVALIGIGMTVIIITGGIDVSVGSIVMVCSVVVAQQLVANHPERVSHLLLIDTVTHDNWPIPLAAQALACRRSGGSRLDRGGVDPVARHRAGGPRPARQGAGGRGRRREMRDRP